MTCWGFCARLNAQATAFEIAYLLGCLKFIYYFTQCSFWETPNKMAKCCTMMALGIQQLQSVRSQELEKGLYNDST